MANDLIKPEVIKEAVKLFTDLADGKNTRNRGGICYALKKHTQRWRALDAVNVLNKVSALCKQWPLYTGAPSFPVPHPKYAPYTAFNLYSDSRKMFDGRTTYGKNRRLLAQFLADEFRKMS